MSGFRLDPFHLKWVGFGLLILGIFVITLALVADPQSAIRRYWSRYLAYLERRLRMMFIWTPAKVIAILQILLSFAIVAMHIVVDLPVWYLFIVAIAVLPAWYIERMRTKRVEAIESQLDGFLTALANALKSTPSIGSAFVSITPILHKPLKDEVELATKEMKVGSTLEQALLNMAGRVGSIQLDSALSAIVIGRQVGGDLPRILETSAETLREMARLEGVIRSKTAEGKAQLWVLAIVPFLMILGLNAVFEGYFAPLSESIFGYAVAFAAGGFWLASILVARKVLTVDV